MRLIVGRRCTALLPSRPPVFAATTSRTPMVGEFSGFPNRLNADASPAISAGHDGRINPGLSLPMNGGSGKGNGELVANLAAERSSQLRSSMPNGNRCHNEFSY